MDTDRLAVHSCLANHPSCMQSVIATARYGGFRIQRRAGPVLAGTAVCRRGTLYLPEGFLTSVTPGG